VCDGGGSFHFRKERMVKKREKGRTRIEKTQTSPSFTIERNQKKNGNRHPYCMQ
jgi:hypothetical protein